MNPKVALGGELMSSSVFKRGDVFYADLSPVVGSEQGGNASGFDYSK